MSIERIERALELARAQRGRVTEQLVAAASPPPPLPPIERVEPAFAGSTVRIAEAPIAQLPAREILRERYVVFPDEKGLASQAYKMLRTQILQRARQHAMRCIGVVSAVSGEGKSVTAINLALSFAAEPTQTVLLVDLDLRRPSLARVLGIEGGEGIESVLTSDVSLAQVLRRVSISDRLGVVPAGAPVAASSELLATPRAAQLMRDLRGAAGDPLVLVDLPPVLLSDDVLAIAPLLDGIVLVVTEERTRREDVQRVFELLRNTPVIGTVLNSSADAESRAY